MATANDSVEPFRQRALRILRDLASHPQADLEVHRIWQDLMRVVLRHGVPDHLSLAFQIGSEFLAAPWPHDQELVSSVEWADARLRDARLGVALLSLCRAELIPSPDYQAASADPTIPEALKRIGSDIAVIKRENLPTAELQKLYDQTVDLFRLRDQRVARQQELLQTIRVFSASLRKFIEKRYSVGPVRFEELSEVMLMAGFDLAQRRAVLTAVMKATGKKPADFLVTGVVSSDQNGF